MKFTSKLKQSASVNKIPTIQPDDRRIVAPQPATSKPSVQAPVKKKKSFAPDSFKEDPLAQAIEQEREQTCSTQESARLALALSGGVDSMLLAEYLYRLKIPFTALHFNHLWRVEQSTTDARFIQDWCQKRSIPCHIGAASTTGATSENQARTQRLHFFKTTCKALQLSEIWMAHHADDLVETFLMQLLRGAGPEGLASLQARRSLEKLVIVRPWLGFFKSQLTAQAQAWKLVWHEDLTNQTPTYLRNRVRRQLLPFLSELAQREVRPQLLRTATLIADENAYWTEKLPVRWPAQARVSYLHPKPAAFQRRWIKGWLHAQNVSDVSFDTIEAIRQLILRKNIVQNKHAQVNLSQGRFCRRSGDFLKIL